MVSEIKKILACVALGLMVQGCETSELISKANPANWFEDEEPAPENTQPVPGEGEEFPAIGSVPERPATPDIKEEYEELKSGLVADKENARYTDQAIRSGAIPEGSMQNSTANLATAEAVPEEPPVARSVQQAPSAAETPAPSAPLREQPQQAPAAEPLGVAEAPQQVQTPPPSAAPIAGGNQASTGAAVQASPSASAAGDQQAAEGGEHIANIYFGDGQTQLSQHDQNVVGQVVAIFNDKGGQGVQVVGHSSAAAGTADHTKAGLVNFKVSLDRASAVAAELVRRGIPKAAIQVDARGAAQPLYTENTKQAQAYNRRAEIFILY